MKRSAIRGLHVAIAIPDCAALHPSYNWPMGDELAHRRFKLLRRARKPATGGITMNGNRYYGIRVEGAKYGVGFGSALAIAFPIPTTIRSCGRSSTVSWAGST